MAVKTTLEQLEEVQAAITEVMSAQEYETEKGIKVKKARLEALQKREEILLARYRRESSTDRSGVLTRPNFSGVSVNEID